MERQNSLQTDGHSSDRQGRSSQTPMWKAVLVGEEGVGKTSLFQRLYRNRFVEHFRSTIGMDQGELTVTHEASGKVCRFSLWDTAGSERHASITLSYYRNSVVVLLVFSLDSQLSLPKLRNWVADAKMFSPPLACF
ncbi:ras-related protein RabC-like [Sycon ciliatum]|uniref:ras-related protein RabC-like n=1 Tax=Sycon ciliatum TaxID=27933 RepID=UPI0031F653C5